MNLVRTRDHWNELFWGPWNDFDRIRNELGSLLGHGTTRYATFPPMNVWSGDEGLLVTLELAGVDPDSLDINVEGEMLTVRGERKAEPRGENDRFLRRERTFGSFERSMRLPFHVDVDGVAASYERGQLEIRLPRAASEKPRRIAVKAS